MMTHASRAVNISIKTVSLRPVQCVLSVPSKGLCQSTNYV